MRHFVSNTIRNSSIDELTFYIAPEDCASRSLTKQEMGDEPEGDTAAQETEMNDDEWQKENGDEDGEEGDPEPKVARLSEYEKRREQNKAEIALILAGLEEQYQIPEDLARMSKAKKPATKKKKRDNNPAERRVSMRNKENDQRQVVVILT